MRAFAKYKLTRWSALLLSAFLAFEPVAYAQYGGSTIPPPANAPMQAQPAFSQQELDQMLAPIAIYPDPLLSQILMASTYPLEVVEAARWSRANPNFRGDDAVRAVQQMDWDPSVKSLAAFPQILQMMDDKLGWTERLGDAFMAQEPQVMDTVQNLRQRAYAASTLRSNDQIRVEPEGQTIVVEPANPDVVYVPYYDPTVVYGSWWWPDYPPIYWAPWPGYYFESGFAPGFAWDIGIPIVTGFFFGDFDWHRRRVKVVNVNNYYYKRPAHDERNTTRNVNTAPRVWQHDPDHRRGVPYRKALLRQQYGRASTSPEVRRDFRGYDPSSFSDRGGPRNRRNEGGGATVLPSRPDSLSGPVASPGTRATEIHSFVGGGSASQPSERGSHTHPSMPIVVNRPATEVRPHAFEGIEHGSDVRIHSARGHASSESTVHSQSAAPAQRPADNAPVDDAHGGKKQHLKVNEQSRDTYRDDTKGQRKP